MRGMKEHPPKTPLYPLAEYGLLNMYWILPLLSVVFYALLEQGDVETAKFLAVTGLSAAVGMGITAGWSSLTDPYNKVG